LYSEKEDEMDLKDMLLKIWTGNVDFPTVPTEDGDEKFENPNEIKALRGAAKDLLKKIQEKEYTESFIGKSTLR
jgi:hypothetical protein